eukprot:TRINITY_DN55393_c0_g1_i1.p1 TRINITY_DN55393_c0_g1~~TRINITY_DN55393_c0_g1_i1.p1  ORF type:complete len:628 (+),score=125.65 TRINITY_DN55393_c0_g1_i1:65-1948(+)
MAFGGDAKRQRTDASDTLVGGLEAEYYVEQHLVGWLIGKSGATLKEVETSFGVKVSFDQTTKEQGYSRMRIGGDAAAVQASAEHMNASLARAAMEVNGGQSDGPLGPFLLDAPPEASSDAMSENMRIEQPFVGWLLGKGGGTMREVETASGCKISVNQDTRAQGYSMAVIYGDQSQRTHAKQLITDSIDRAKRGGGGSPPPSAAMAFSGGVTMPNGGGSDASVQVEQKWVGWLLGKSGGVAREIETETGTRLKIDQTTKQLGYSTIEIEGTESQRRAAKDAISKSLAKAGGSIMGQPATGGGCAPSAKAAFASSAPTASMAFGGGGGGASGGSQTVQLKVEQKWVGWLVGRGGGMVKEIETSTGAKVSLNQDTKPQGYSVATIKGEASQVQSAKNIITDKIGQVSGGTGVTVIGGGGGAEVAASAGTDDLELKRAIDKITSVSGDPSLQAQLQSLMGAKQSTMIPEQFVELQLEQKYVGWLLGSRGKTVRDIEAATNAKVGIDQATKEMGYSILRLTGTAQACEQAQERIEASLTLAVSGGEAGGEEQSGSSQEDSLQVEQKKVGWILGKGGVVMKEIETQSGAKISIDQSTRDMGFSTVQIRGSEHACQLAKQLITDKVQQAGNGI